MISYVEQKSPLNAHADVSKGAGGIKFCLSLYLHPYFGCVSSKGSGECAHLRQAHLSLGCSTML